MVYLDNAATTYPKPEAVYRAMDEANRQYAVNAGRGSYRKAKEASEKIAMLKSELRKLIHADYEAPVVIGPSVTVALNQVINGMDLHPGETVYLSPYEHNAVARTLYRASKEKGFAIEKIPIDEKTLEVSFDVMRYQFSKRIEQYSEGQKKKVLIASSLLTPAHLYIWDEPLNYIDVFTRMQIEKLIDIYKPTMLIVEHDVRFKEKVATKIISL